ncbi:MAG: hypothetical protein ABIN36_16550 [Ferruginibacter sp.]
MCNAIMTTFKLILFFFFICIFSNACTTTLKNNIARNRLNAVTAYYTSTEKLMSNNIPDSVFQMLNLRTLSVSGMDCDLGLHSNSIPDDGIKCWMISEIPARIENLKLLDTLSISLATFLRLPDEISTLKNLKVVILTDCLINNIDNLMSLTELTDLYLDGTAIHKLPLDIGNLKQLKYLGLVNDNIDSLEIFRIKAALPNCEVHY